ncbi:unnamed protein product [Paramecium octaurelia]|uniref:PHD-type domain-containing protein n=1 Tax=Paramecium octaurelia TaxID=43137 RepID=A0A8S1Y8Y5_PAROT|nr:unnamed protein product [Paramecium octaurelia]
MNLYLEQAAEEIEQAISDADQLLALSKATIQKFTNYLKRKQQEKMDRRFHLNTTMDESNSMKQLDKHQLNQLKILEFFNKAHKDIDKQLRELKEMIPSNPQTFIIEDINDQEYINKQTEQKQLQKGIPQETKYFPIFKQAQNGGQKNQNSLNLNQHNQITNQINSQPQQSQQNLLVFQQQQVTPQQKENNQLKIQSAPQLDLQCDNQKSKLKQTKENKDNKDQIITFGRLQKFSYQKLLYPKKDDGNCIFCGLEANDSNLGPLLQIPSNRNPNEKFDLHEMCGLWSQNLVFFNKQGQCDPSNIDDEVDKSKQTKCFLCSRTGATVCCAVCPEAFHFTCLMKSSSTGKLVESQFKFFCDIHKKKAQNEKTSSEENSQIKRPKKTCYKLNQSKALIKTSPKRSPRRSPKRFKSPSSKQIKISKCIIPKDDKDVHQNNLQDLMSQLLKQYETTQQQNSSLIQESDLKLEA